jgi:hypothetical protein
MKIYDIIKPQHSSTNLLYVVANGYELSEFGRISRSLIRKTDRKMLWWKYRKIQVTELTASMAAL